MSGYQWGDTNGFGAGGSSLESDAFVDGFSLSSGDGSGAQHVFTYAVGLTTYSASGFGDRDGNCPDFGGRSPPSFVGSNYACNTTNSGTSYPRSWSSSLVFDEEAFSMELDSESSEDLTGRIRANECATNEDLGITELTLFVR